MIQGDRFELDLDAGGEAASDGVQAAAPLSLPFVGDVWEREPTAAAPPSAPTLRSKTGFPPHAKRNVQSRFKQKAAAAQVPVAHDEHESPVDAYTREPNTVTDSVSTPPHLPDISSQRPAELEREHIDRENRDRLAGMSPSEIEEARQELMGSLDPALIQRILLRANIDSGSNEADTLHQLPPPPQASEPRKPKSTKAKKVSFQEPEADEAAQPISTDDADAASAQPLPHDTVHFPRPDQPPDLDPDSATFLDDLHDKYFPSLPADPDKLEWMRPSTTGKDTYDPAQSALNPRDIRFAFTGELIPPRTASAIPVSAGLHHHGDAPQAAGYTIPELAHLSRSTFAPQRCIAFQTLGRILYRLGKGDFGDPGEPGANTVGVEETLGELARGLWREVETQHVIEHLVAESEGNGVDGGRHLSAKAYATEAVWLWRRGGGRRWKAD